MSAEDGHHYSFGAPHKGWPTFGPDGRIVKDEEEKDEQTNGSPAPTRA